MYLSDSELRFLTDLLQAFFRLPYSTDLDGKDAETLIRIVKGVTGSVSKRKELFDIVDGPTGYSVKTLKKSPKATRVDLQEQRLGEVEKIRTLRGHSVNNAVDQGEILIDYMLNRIHKQMALRRLSHARSLVLLKHWNTLRTNFYFRYWEEDFLHYVENLYARNKAGEIEWLIQDAGLHGRDRNRQDDNGQNVRLIRMHYKHNQIFTDHDIPADTCNMNFTSKNISWIELINIINSYDKSASDSLNSSAQSVFF